MQQNQKDVSGNVLIIVKVKLILVCLGKIHDKHTLGTGELGHPATTEISEDMSVIELLANGNFIETRPLTLVEAIAE